MKKNKSNENKITKILIVFAIVIFIFSLVKIGTAQKSTNIVEITNVEILSKSDTVDVDDIKFEDGTIKNNVIFHKVGDQLIYNVTITNKGNKDYVLKNITDNNENENLTYSYSGYEGAKLEADKAATFSVIITYSKELSDIEKREYKNVVVLTLLFEDEAGQQQQEEIVIEPDNTIQEENDVTERDNIVQEENDVTEPDNIAQEENDVTEPDNRKQDENTVIEPDNKSKIIPKQIKLQNPKTSDNVIVYVIIAIISFFFLLILTIKQFLISKKAKNNSKHGNNGKSGMKFFGLILVIVLSIPAFTIISKAATTSMINISIETSIKSMDKLIVNCIVDGEETELICKYNEEIDLPDAEEKPGYEFKGWFTEPNTAEDDDSKKVEGKIQVTEDLKLYAKYKMIDYDIIYNLNGGIVEDNPETYTVDDEIVLNNPSKQGYIFTGWTGTGLDEQVTDVTIIKGSTGDRTYTAHYSKITGNITITVLNEDDDLYERQVSIATQVNNIDLNKTKTQYSIDGGATWTDYTGVITLTQNCILKARTIIKEDNIIIAETSQKITVIKKYTIVFNKNSEDATGTMENQVMTVGTAANLTAKGFKRTGYKFDGWNTEANGTGTNYTDGQSVNNLTTIDGETVNLYAKWKNFEVKVGDTVYYTPSTVNEYKWNKEYATSDQTGNDILRSGNNQSYNISQWYVFSVNEDVIEIVPKSPSPNVVLGGAQGYNNGVKLLNDACSALYSDTEKGITARSLNIDDIESVFSEESLNIARNTNLYDGAYLHWMERLNNAFTAANSKYPQMYENEYKSVIAQNGVLTEKNEGLGVSEQTEFIERTAKNNYNGLIMNASSIWPYNTFYRLNRNSFAQHLGSLYTKVLLNNGSPTYWVATRSVLVCGDNMVNFDIRLVDNGEIDANFLLRSAGYGRNVYKGLFPVVKLNIDNLEETAQAEVFNVK